MAECGGGTCLCKSDKGLVAAGQIMERFFYGAGWGEVWQEREETREENLWYAK